MALPIQWKIIMDFSVWTVARFFWLGQMKEGKEGKDIVRSYDSFGQSWWDNSFEASTRVANEGDKIASCYTILYNTMCS